MTTKERILENTMDLFLSRGCKSLTMDEIAIENGVSKRTLYELFFDKSTLLEECIKAMNLKKKALFIKMREESDNVLEQLLKIHDFQSESFINMSENFFDEVKRFFPDIYMRTISKAHQEHLNITVQMIRDGQQQGVFLVNLGDLTLKAMVISGFLTGGAGLSDMKKLYSRTEIFKSTVITYIRGLSTDKGIKIIDNYFIK